MSKSAKRTGGLWTYLEQSGVLVNGTDAEIKAVRRQYRKHYLKAYKQKQRQQKPEFLVQLSRTDGTHARIKAAAGKHRMSITEFLRMATLAYIDRAYLVPDRQLVGKFAGLLESCLNDVRAMTSVKGKHSVFALEEKYNGIEERIAVLETEVRNLFFFPAMLEQAVHDAVRNNPGFRERLLNILSHAHRED